MITAVIQIGNSDNKLTQGEWANFAASMHIEVSENVHHIHFKGGSDWDAPWQNACWVCEVMDEQIDGLTKAVARCRRTYRQDSAAITWGDTALV
jgi:hypothetical protein